MNYKQEQERRDICEQGSLRERVAQFIDNRPETTNFKGDKYYAYEDALVDFILEIIKEVE